MAGADPPSLSLRFHNLPGQDIGGKFDDPYDEHRNDAVTKLTRGPKGYNPPIPSGVEGSTWKSALLKQQKPPLLLRLVTLGCCCNRSFSITRAQWIWLLNLLAFAVHSVWAILVWREGRGKGEKMEIAIHRISSVWNETEGRGSYTHTLVDNGKPIRIDWITLAFFAISALAHLFIVALGPFDRYVWLIWRQLDLCFVYWRWIEYSVSASVMILAIGLTVGIRDETTLATIFLLMWVTCLLGLLTELWSRPHGEYESDQLLDMERWQGDLEPVEPNKSWRELSSEQMCARVLYAQRRRVNYLLRMIPVGIGITTFAGTCVIVLNAFYKSLDDLRHESEDLLDEMPKWVPALVFGTLAIFSLFAFPIIIYQWLPPRHFWQTEVIYCLLSLTAKVYLGGYLYAFVIMSGDASESLQLKSDLASS